MVRSNEALSYLIYICNSWNEEECALVFNGENNVNMNSYLYSLGWHIWDKYRGYVEDYGLLAAPSLLLLELDDNNREKILNRACELYDGRRNRK